MVSDRARQFMPFSALKGFHELIQEKERVITAKKELSEDDMRELSDKIKAIEKGMMIKIIYFCRGEYVTAEGIVTTIDITYRFLTVVKTKISFDDIIDITAQNCDTLF